MIIECDNCATRFRLDDTRVTGGGVKVRCTKCQNVFIVKPPAESKEGASPERALEEAKGAEDTAAAPASIKIEPAETPAEPDEAQPDEKEEEEYHIPKLSFSELDVLSPDAPGEEGGERIEEILDAVYKDEFDPPSKTGSAEDGGTKNGWPDPTDFSFDEDDEPEGADKPGGDDAFAGILDDAVATGAEEPEPEPKPEPEAEEETQEAASPEPPPPPPERAPIPKAAPRFGAALTSQPGQKKRTTPGAMKAAPKSSPTIGIVIAALIFIGGGATIYFSGIIDTLSGALVTTAAERPIKIESLSGSFIENERAGRVFVIKARLSNITGEDQLVNEVRAAIYDRAGKAIAERTVSAGRVVSDKELRTLSSEELLGRFNDASGATLPPKGSIPIMALFIDASEAIVEYGIDVLR